MRKKHSEFLPKIIDIVDDFSMFTNQGKKRNALYVKRKYFIKNYFYNCENSELIIHNDNVNIQEKINDCYKELKNLEA